MQLATQIFGGNADEAAISVESHPLAQNTLSKNSSSLKRKHHSLPAFTPAANVPTSTLSSCDFVPSPTSVTGQSSSQPAKKKSINYCACRFICQYINKLEAHKVTEHDLSSFSCEVCVCNGYTSKRSMEEHKRRQHLRNSDTCVISSLLMTMVMTYVVNMEQMHRNFLRLIIIKSMG